jgi:Protein of unknown function (DUF3800)
MEQHQTEKIYIILDEFGNPHLNLEKLGTFSHFVYTAIVFKESEKENITKARDIISKKYFQNSPMKSKNIGNDDKGNQKRIDILNELKKYDFIVFSLIINKSELQSKGLEYSRVFYKFFQRIFIEKFAQNYTSFHIYADNVGDPEFRKGLKHYLEQNAIKRDLFSPDRFYTMAEDKFEEPLIQLADILCGCLGKIYCISHQHPNYEILFEIIRDRLFVEFYPSSYKNFLGVAPSEKNEEKDKKIGKIAIDGILEFVDNNSCKYMECIEIAKYLLLIFKSNPNKLVSTKELINIVKKRYGKYSQDILRQHIAFMRDNGLIIVSPQGKYGYKIPNSVSDMVGFFNRYLSSIKPMLRRIEKSNDLISLKTINDVNVIQQTSNFAILDKLIEAMQKDKIK